MKQLLFLVVFFTSITADSVLYRIDGANNRSLNLDKLSFQERFGLIHGNSSSTLSELLQQDHKLNDSVLVIGLSGIAGSEIYDPLLNLYEETNTINSDHFSSITGRALVPQANLSIKGIYTYEDRYSQQFDRFSNSYSELWGRVLPMSSYGLIEDLYFNAMYQSDRSTSLLSVLSYNRWGVLPGFSDQYSFRSGMSIRGGGETSYKKISIFALAGIDKYRDMLGDLNEKLSTDTEGEFGGAYHFGENRSLGFKYLRNQKFYLSDLLKITMKHKYNLLLWTIAGGAYIQGGFLVEANTEFPIGANADVSLDFSGGNIRAENDQTWFALNRPLSFSADLGKKAVGDIKINYSRSDFTLPFSISLISKMDRFPRYEHIDSSMESFAVKIGTFDDRSVVALGVRAKLSFERTFWGANFDGMLRGDLLDSPELSTPGFYRIKFRAGRDSLRSFHADFTFEHRAPVTQIRVNSSDNTLSEFSTRWSSSMGIRIFVPIVSPFLERNLIPTIELGAGPVRFGHEQMLREIPGANPVGPEIFLGFRGDIIIPVAL